MHPFSMIPFFVRSATLVLSSFQFSGLWCAPFTTDDDDDDVEELTLLTVGMVNGYKLADAMFTHGGEWIVFFLYVYNTNTSDCTITPDQTKWIIYIASPPRHHN